MIIAVAIADSGRLCSDYQQAVSYRFKNKPTINRSAEQASVKSLINIAWKRFENMKIKLFVSLCNIASQNLNYS